MAALVTKHIENPSSGSAPSPRWRKICRRLALLAMAFVFAAVMSELGLRIAGYRPMAFAANWEAAFKTLHRTATANPLIPYELVPGARARFPYRGPTAEYRINDQGLRANRTFVRPKPAGTQRVLMLGDSILFGFGVSIEQTFAALVEKKTSGVEVVNAGIGGFSTAVERAWLETVGMTFEPNVIVLCYCPNDVDDPLDHFSFHTRESQTAWAAELIPNPAYHRRRQEELDRQSAAGGGDSWFLRSAVWTMRQSALAYVCAKPFGQGRLTKTYERCVLAMADEQSPEAAWLSGEFQRIASLAAARSIPMLFVYMPLAYELGADDPAYPRSRHNVERLAQAVGVRVVDVCDALAHCPNSHLDVSHLSSAGHEAVAGALAAVVTESSKQHGHSVSPG